jgi:hypothetical protein
MQTNIPLESLPVWLLVALSVAVVLQLTLEVWALVDMLRRPAEQLNLGGRKWLWAIIILCVNSIGAIIYFAAGRKPPVAADVVPAAPVAQRAQAAVDTLYGPSEDGGPR